MKTDKEVLPSSFRTLLSELTNTLKVVTLALNDGVSFQQIQCFVGS
jgi:hypothetical protein